MRHDVSYPVPANESERLDEFKRLRTSEWGFSAALDRLCAIAARQLRTPIALVSLIGENHQYFAARRGIEDAETSREVSFCTHAIMQPSAFVVPDATADPRFAENPLVTGDPRIRAYAGVPLETAADLRVGAFCAIDVKPRAFTEEEVALLAEFGGIATAMIEFERVKLNLDEALKEAGTMQQELQRQTDALERSNRELGDFAQILSHDLKAPIRTIRTYLPEIVGSLRRGEVEAASEDYELVLKSAAHMDELIDTLREYCKVRYRDAPMAEISMAGVVHDVLAMLGPAIEEKGAVIRHGDLPPVIGNTPQLMLLVQNLIANALKFSHATAPQVTIQAKRRGPEVEFWVADNGIGISPKQLERIFEPFYRLHSTEKYSGVGLGLAICQKVVERHGGRIWCESEGAGGSSFHFTLPAAEQERASRA